VKVLNFVIMICLCLLPVISDASEYTGKISTIRYEVFGGVSRVSVQIASSQTSCAARTWYAFQNEGNMTIGFSTLSAALQQALNAGKIVYIKGNNNCDGAGTEGITLVDFKK
jgi:hypothetical protein